MEAAGIEPMTSLSRAEMADHDNLDGRNEMEGVLGMPKWTKETQPVLKDKIY